MTDYERILNLVNSFGLLIDKREWDEFENIFYDNVEFDYSSAYGPEGTFNPQEIRKQAAADLGPFEATHHLISNVVIIIDNDLATVKAHARPLHFHPNSVGEPILETGGMYDGKLLKVDGHWKINFWKYTVQWSRGNNSLFEMVKE